MYPECKNKEKKGSDEVTEGFVSSMRTEGEKFSKRILEGWFTQILIMKNNIFSYTCSGVNYADNFGLIFHRL